MKKPDIVLVYPNYFPEHFGDSITTDILNEKLNLLLEREEPKIWASIEWAIPGIIMAYILKPYFESFLKEAGKDHYNLLKKFLNRLLKIGKTIPVKTVTSSTSPLKLDKSNTQSKALSIHFELKDGQRLKLLFDNELELNDWINALSSLLDIVQEHYSSYPNDQLTLELEPLEKKSAFEIIATINQETKEWEFHDYKAVIEKARK